MARAKFTREKPTSKPLDRCEIHLLQWGSGGNGDLVAVGAFGGEAGARRAWETHRDEIESTWHGVGRCWAARKFDGLDIRPA